MSNTKLLTLSQGNTYTITYSLVDSATQEPKDLTGTSTLKFALAKNRETTVLAEFSRGDDLDILGDPTDGVITVSIGSTILNALSEGRYYFEIWHQNAELEPITLVSQKVNLVSKLITA